MYDNKRKKIQRILHTRISKYFKEIIYYSYSVLTISLEYQTKRKYIIYILCRCISI